MINPNQNILFLSMVLALCVLSFVHVFLFPLYDLNAKRTFLKTFSDLEQQLCIKHSKHSKKAIRRFRRCPQYGIVTVQQGGRLGNQISSYATVWAIARRTGLEPYVPQCLRKQLDLVFESLSVPTFEEINHCPFNLNRYVESLDEWNYTNQSIVVPKSTYLFKLSFIWVQDLIQEFTIKKKLLQKSEKILLKASKGVRSNVFVGMHVRRKDYIKYLLKKYVMQPADVGFYNRAMKYYKNKFENITFVIVSDDPMWCHEKFGHLNNVYIASKDVQNETALDLAILASCNHTIFDYGTYGTWGAILAGGETIYFLSSYGRLLPYWQQME